jgi:hypothetical protein
MAVADLSLALNVQSSGTAEIDKLISALNKYSDKIDQIRNQKPPETAPWEKFGQDVKNAIENPLQAAGTAAKGLLDKLGPVGTGMALFGGAAIAAGVATVNIARQMGDLGLSIQNTALRMGLSTKEVGQFTYAAKLAGGDIGSLEGAMRKLSLGLADSGADGEKARRGLAALGVSARDANGEIRSTNDIFLDISRGLNSLGSAAERNSAAVKIFGRAGIELIPILVGLSETVAKAKEMGLGLDEKTVKGLDDAHKELAEIAARWTELARQPKIILTLEVAALLKWIRGDGGDKTGGGHGDDKGPMTPGEKEVQRYWSEREASPQGKADELRAQIATYGNRSDPEALSHLATLWTQLATQDDLAGGGGKRILDKALAGTGGSVDAQLAAARKALEGVQGEARGMDENKQGVTTDAARDMALRLADAQRRVNQLEVEKQAAEDEKKASANALAEERKRSTGIGAMSKRADELGMSPIQKAIAEGSTLGLTPLGGGPLTRLLFGQGWIEGPAKGGMIGELQKQPVTLAETDWDARQKTTSEQFVKDLKAATKPDEEELRKSMGVYDVLAGLQKTEIESGLTKTLAGTSAKFLGKVEEPEAALASRKQAANDVYKIEVDRAMLAQTSGERELDLARALAEFKRSLWSAEDQHQADLEKAEQDAQQRAEELAGGVFAGLTNKKGPGTGLREFGLGQVNQLEKGVFTNLTTPYFQDIGKMFGKIGAGATGGSSFVGGLLQGTIFDPDHGKDAVKPSIDAATKSVVALTSSVDALTDTLGGTAPASTTDLGSLLPLVAGGGFGSTAGGAGGLVKLLAGSGGAGGGGGSGGLLGGLFGPSVSGSLPAGYSSPVIDYASLFGITPIVPNGSIGGLNPIDSFSAMADSAAAGGALPGPTSLSSASTVNVGSIGKQAESAVTAISKLFKTPSSTDTSARSQAIGDIGKGVAAGFEIYNGIKTGGAKGGVEDVAGGLMAASMFSGPAAPFLAAGGAILSMVSSMFGDPKVARQNQLNKELTDWHFFQPQALSSMMDGSGELTNYDARGNVRGTPYSGWRFDVTQSHYGDKINGQPTPIPGSAQPVYIYAMDAQSFAQFATTNRTAIANSQYQAIQEGHPLVSAIRAVTGTA